ncbi:MAG: hypothetical protein ACJAYU_004550 [Bradymonadia bacterium]
MPLSYQQHSEISPRLTSTVIGADRAVEEVDRGVEVSESLCDNTESVKSGGVELIGRERPQDFLRLGMLPTGRQSYCPEDPCVCVRLLKQPKLSIGCADQPCTDLNPGENEASVIAGSRVDRLLSIGDCKIPASLCRENY